jgi:serine/threonine protein kinase
VSQLKSYSRGDVIAKKYEIESMLGQGMLGTSYLAHHIASGRQLVIKFVRPNLVAEEIDRLRFKDIFEKVRAVRGELLIRVHETGVQEEQIFYTEEYFESQSLRALVNEYVSEKKVFTLQEACQIAISVLEACEEGHKAGFIHRNVKPENVLVQTRKTGPAASAKAIRTIKVSGLGFAGLMSSTLFAENFVSREEAYYLAPELSSFDQEAQTQADVYSVGVLLYELLCGEPPIGTYIAPTKIREDIPEHMDTIIEIAIARNPEDRYPTPRDMINDIQRSFLVDTASTQLKQSFRTVLLGVGAAVALGAVVGGYYVWGRGSDPQAASLAEDNAVRAQLQQANKLPSDDEVKRKLANHLDMVYIPAGTFLSGRLKSESLQVATPSEAVDAETRTGSFFIDRFEFPNQKGAKPAVRVSWKQAEEVCAQAGKRLCTDVEWEKACKGPQNFVYSYGDAFDAATCGENIDQPYLIGEREACKSGYGVYDISGGVREWTTTQPGDKDGRRMVKGGLRANPQRGSRCAYEVDESTGYSEATMGFRCCLDDEPSTAQGGAAAP